MSRALLFLLLGTGAGALYASLALGLVLAHRGSGVVNLAHGATAMYTAYTYSELRTSGRLMVPPLPNPLALIEGLTDKFLGWGWEPPKWPTFVDVGGRLTVPSALVLSLVVAALLGLALHGLVFRPLRGAPPLAKVVATVGVMVVLQSTVGLRFGSEARNVEPILPSNGVDVGVGTVPVDRFWLVGLVGVATALLYALFRYTRFGLATRAAAENEKGALLLGWSPTRLAATNWVMATVLAGLFGILVAPVTSISPGNFTLYVIPALAAALAGRFESFPIAAGVGIALGMFDQLLVYLDTQPAFDWLPNGSRQALPFVVIALVVGVSGRSLPSRGSLLVDRLPPAPAPTRVVSLVVVMALGGTAGLLLLGYEWRQSITTTLLGAVIALSIVVLTGYVGQISLAQMTIAGVGAFALTRVSGSWGVPFPVAPLLAALVGTVVGVVIGLPALRIRGVHLAVITLAFAWTVQEMVFNNRELLGTAGSSTKADPPELFGVRFGPLDRFFLGDDKVPTAGFGLFVLLVATLMVAGVANLRRSTTGRRMIAVRANERAAAAAGIDVVRTKLLAFTISSFIAAVGGTLLSYQAGGSVSSTGFAALTSLTALALVYLAGIGSVSGALVAGALASGGLVFHAAERIYDVGPWEQLAAGLGLVIAAVAHPAGIVGSLPKLRRVRVPVATVARPAPERVTV